MSKICSSILPFRNAMHNVSALCLLAIMGITLLASCNYDPDRKERRERRNRTTENRDKNKGGDSYQIIKVDGNTVTIKKSRQRLKAVLLGVNDTRDVESYIKRKVSGPVNISFDSGKQPRRLSNNARVYAYLNDQFGNSINGAILWGKVSGLNSKYVTDSLSAFQSYASGRPPTNPVRPTNPTNPVRPSITEDPPEKQSKFSVSAVSKAAFKVETYDGRGRQIGQGSGFFISSDGIGVSNHHVFDKGKNWRLTTCGDTKTYTIGMSDIIAYDEDLDYIIFKVPVRASIPHLRRATRTPEQGDDIYVYGNPKGLTCTLSKGVVSAIREYDNVADNIIQIDAAISPGSSGSPVVNKRGEVVGIATMKQLECENCNFAMNIKVLNRDLR